MTIARTFAAGIAALMLTVGAASANTISIIDTSPAEFTVDCPSGCSGVLGDGSLSATNAQAFEIGSANAGNIASFLSDLINTTIMTSAVAKFDLGGDDDDADFSFDVTPGYFFTKYATFTAFFFTDSSQTVRFLKTGGGQGGLSNYGTIDGDVPEIPLPAAGWMLLAGLGGLAAVRRRKAA